MRFLVIVLGAIPASLMALLALLAFLGAFDRLSHQPLVGLLGLIWSISGILGCLGAWLSIVYWDRRQGGQAQVVFYFIILGLVSAIIFLSLYVDLENLKWALAFATPVFVGTLVAYRFRPRDRALETAAIGLAVLLPPVIVMVTTQALTKTCLVTQEVTMSCGKYGPCEKYISYVIPGDSVLRSLRVDGGLSFKSAPSIPRNVSATFEVKTIVGIDSGFRLVEIDGHKYHVPNKNRIAPGILPACPR